MKENLVITISGLPGAGTTTVSKKVAEYFGLRYFSAGNAFRKIAAERGLELPLMNETAEKEVDEEVDNRSRAEAEKAGVVIESKIGAWINKETADVKIWLEASLETRANRIFNDEKTRVAEKYVSLDEAKEAIQKRKEADKKRYMDYYQIDLDDKSVYDLVIDTENITSEEVINKVIEYIENREP